MKLCEENTKQPLEIHEEETRIMVEERKRDNDAAMQLLGDFPKI